MFVWFFIWMLVLVWNSPSFHPFPFSPCFFNQLISLIILLNLIMQIICEPASICLFSIAYWLHLCSAFLMSNNFFFILPLFIATNPSSSRRRQWQPTPVLLPGKSHGQRSLVGCSPWGHEESDMTECLHIHFSLSCIGEGHGNSLQCSCLENPRDGGAWWAAVYGVAQNQTRLKWFSSSSSSIFLHPPHVYMLSCDPRDCSPPGSSLHGNFQARILECIGIFFSIMSNNFLFCTQTQCVKESY